jgi:hypothetical protein
VYRAVTTGRIGDQSISLHAEGEKVVLTKGGRREEVDLGATGPRQDEPVDIELPLPVAAMGNPPDHPATADAEEPPPGTSPLDAIQDLLGEEDPS